jgi:hypothetical protein
MMDERHPYCPCPDQGSGALMARWNAARRRRGLCGWQTLPVCPDAPTLRGVDGWKAKQFRSGCQSNRAKASIPGGAFCFNYFSPESETRTQKRQRWGQPGDGRQSRFLTINPL